MSRQGKTFDQHPRRNLNGAIIDLCPAELDDLAGEALPERAAMSLINANVAVPVNAAVAANVLTDHSTADATSAPNGPITQQPDLRS